MSPKRRVSVLHCVKGGVYGARIMCRCCLRTRWMSWGELRVSLTDDLEFMPFRLRLRCTECGGREFSLRAAAKRD